MTSSPAYLAGLNTIRQANRLRTIGRAALLILALAVAFTLGFILPGPEKAHAAGIALGYSTGGAKVRQIGTWQQKVIHVQPVETGSRWPVAKVARKISQRTGLNIAVGNCPAPPDANPDPDVYEPAFTESCVAVVGGADLPGKRKALVSLWSEGASLYAASVELDNHNTRKWGKAKRERQLCLYVGRSAGLNYTQTKAACR